MQGLAESCTYEYDVVVDYISAAQFAKSHGADTCERLEEYSIELEAIQLLRTDGYCLDAPPVPAAPQWPDGGIGWDEAHNYVGGVQSVCGPLKSIRGTDSGVFVNVGQDYPSAARFTFVLWGDWWIDAIPSNATVCSYGEIYVYDGVAQMEIFSPEDLRIWS